MNILVLVTANIGEKPIRRKGAVFSATIISGELVGPKSHVNYFVMKGKQVNIPVLYW
jgi:hypothetical protein